ncbi:MAG: zf-HC2 domain-containing protein, partial [Planctomycetes bacterium]|nr:zf-HC2 domain-containing protein [Planctomycetota bacterium]
MDCKTAQPQLGLYLDKTMAPGERAPIEAHLARCRHCAEELAELTETISALVPQAHVPVPEQLWTSIEARLDQHRSPRLLWRIFQRP